MQREQRRVYLLGQLSSVGKRQYIRSGKDWIQISKKERNLSLFIASVGAGFLFVCFILGVAG